jgi:SAM-dependent methyltransferase
MLAYERASRPPAIVADITALPIESGSVGGAVSAFSLSHVDRPGGVLAECRRVVRPGGPVIAGVFAASGSRHPATSDIEAVAARWGWSPPSWYVHMKNDLEPSVADGDALGRLAADAGLDTISVTDVDVDAGLDTAAALVAWRFAGPALANWIATLPRPDRQAVVHAAVSAVGADPQPLRVTVRILSSIVPADF